MLTFLLVSVGLILVTVGLSLMALTGLVGLLALLFRPTA
jgi:hypothetical protein